MIVIIMTGVRKESLSDTLEGILAAGVNPDAWSEEPIGKRCSIVGGGHRLRIAGIADEYTYAASSA